MSQVVRSTVETSSREKERTMKRRRKPEEDEVGVCEGLKKKVKVDLNEGPGILIKQVEKKVKKKAKKGVKKEAKKEAKKKAKKEVKKEIKKAKKKTKKEAKKLQAKLKKLAKKLAKLNKVVQQQEKHISHLRVLHDTEINSTILPIVTAAVYKGIYEALMAAKTGAKLREERAYDPRTKALEYHIPYYKRYGMANEEEMKTLIRTFPSIIKKGNEVIHRVRGDDIIAVLPYASAEVSTILRYGFKLLLGISLDDWDRATAEQKSITIEI